MIRGAEHCSRARVSLGTCFEAAMMQVKTMYSTSLGSDYRDELSMCFNSMRSKKRSISAGTSDSQPNGQSPLVLKLGRETRDDDLKQVNPISKAKAAQATSITSSRALVRTATTFTPSTYTLSQHHATTDLLPGLTANLDITIRQHRRSPHSSPIRSPDR